MIKILLAEDHTIVRNGIKTLLNMEPDMEVVAEASDAKEALDILAGGIAVDILLTDIHMPGQSGIELIQQVSASYPNVITVVLSMLEHENYIVEAMRNGASGYLLKNIDKDQMVFAIRHVAAGNKYICSELVFELFKKYFYSAVPASPSESPVELSEREVEVLSLIADGFTNMEIADKLFSSRRTIEGHRQNLLDKTGSRNTASLIRFAIRNNIIQ
ncbi:response regulator transcription factor [Pedobacter sp. BS3]|uniref:response regulator transcription factor n=1 Tax=Pedobacter sp. BS3 TaxID=2567937 RepID=UPI0011EE5325|nr:response regulator transcription factor [Pedobacter sp. BS3]TZF83694.1 response regulator transcription factor [Pedobacter sp. BS3]